MKHLLLALAAALILAGCGGGATSVAPRVPIFPYWTIAELPAGPVSAEHLPQPAAAAVLVAPGYLVASIDGMGDVADDFLMDPTVYVFDGAAWHAGRYVDRDHKYRLALIRADVPGTPVPLPAVDRPIARLLGIPPRLDGEAPLEIAERPAVPCGEAPSWIEEGISRYRRRSLSRCFEGKVADLSGGAMLDAIGALAGLQVNSFASSSAVGPSGSEVRAFLDLYFASWGRAVDPKPAY